jgi:hypothetical protein
MFPAIKTAKPGSICAADCGRQHQEDRERKSYPATDMGKLFHGVGRPTGKGFVARTRSDDVTIVALHEFRDLQVHHQISKLRGFQTRHAKMDLAGLLGELADDCSKGPPIMPRKENVRFSAEGRS